jgi:putative lipoic acid-binding regulatory protein
MSSFFQNPDMVRKQLGLPAVVDLSVIGSATAEYHAKLEDLILTTVGEESIHHRSYRDSGAGSYTAYRYSIFFSDLPDLEAFYKNVGALPGTKAVL